MALQTKTYPGSTSDSSKWTWKIEAIEESASVTTKKSKVTIKEYIGRPSNQTNSYFQGSANLKFVAGSQTHTEKYTTSSKVYVDAGKWVLLGSHTFEVDNTGTDTNPTKITVSGSMSTSDFNPNTASATGTLSLTVLHIAPVLNISSVAENNSNLSGVSGTTFVTNLSKKIFTVGYTLYDDATASSLKIYDKNGNELKSTSSIGTSSGTITVDFSSITLPDNTITNNKTTFIVKIIDSLGGETSITTPEYTIIPYQLPNLVVTSSNVKRNGQRTGKGLLNLIGTFYNAAIGSKKNAITLSFAYWKVGNTESTTYYTISSSANTGSGNNISISNWKIAKNGTEISDLDKSYAYKFKIKAVDTFGNSSIIELICNKGEYIMCEFQDRVDFKKVTVGNKNVSVNNDYIEVNLSAAVTIPAAAYTLIPFNQINEDTYLNENSSFSFDKNGKITITTDDIKKIYIKVSTLVSDWSAKTLYLTINKNGKVVDRSYVKSQSQIFTNVEIPVKKGDVIHSELYCGESVNLSNNVEYSKMIVNVR